MIVLLGKERSGTTWLQYIISEMSDLMCTNDQLTLSIHHELYGSHKHSLECIHKNVSSEDCLNKLKKVVAKSHNFNQHLVLEIGKDGRPTPEVLKARPDLDIDSLPAFPPDDTPRFIRLDPLWKYPAMAEQINLLFVIRDYRECVIRNAKSARFGGVDFEPQSWEDTLGQYLQVLKQYEDFTGPKFLVRYEDLILNTQECVKNVLNFLNVFNKQKYEDFFEKIEHHKQRSLDLYTKPGAWGGSRSYTMNNPTDLEFHRNSQKSSSDENLPSEEMITKKFIEMAGSDVLKRYFGEKDE